MLLQELRDTNVQRDEGKLEIERLNEAIRQSRMTHDDCLRQQRQREEELQDLIRTMDEREIEYQETRKVGWASLSIQCRPMPKSVGSYSTPWIRMLKKMS